MVMPHGNSIHQMPDDVPPRIRRPRCPVLMYEEKRVLGIIVGLIVFACIVNWVAP